MVISYHRFGRSYRSHPQGPESKKYTTLRIGTYMFSRNVGKKLPLLATYKPKRAQFSNRRAECSDLDIGFFFSISSHYFLLSSSFGAVDEKESLLPCKVIACGKPLLFLTFIISQFEKTTARCHGRHGNHADGQDTIYLMVCLKLCGDVKCTSNSVFH